MSALGFTTSLAHVGAPVHAAAALLAQQQSDASWFDRLFNLSRVSWSDPDTVLGWRYALPAWVWVVIVLAAMALAVWSYSRLLGPRPVRMGLAAVRGVLLLLVAALLAGPTLVRHDERIESDWLLMLVDRSASMQVADQADATTGKPMSRDAQLRQALQQQAAVFDKKTGLGQQRHITWLGFDRQTPPITDAQNVQLWPSPDAQATQLRTAMEQALRRAAGQPISGIVLFTDGRSPQTTGAELIKRLQQQAVPVFTVPLGAEEMPLDLAVSAVDHPEQAFVSDVVPVSVTVRQLSGDVKVDPARVRLRLVDTVSGKAAR